MRYILATFFIPFLLFGLSSCGEDLINVSFDYPFEASFEMDEQIRANTPHAIESETIEVRLIDELSQRNLDKIASVRLRELTLTLPENAPLDWSTLISLNAEMVLDGVGKSLAFIGTDPLIDGRTLHLEVSVDEVELEAFLQKTTAQARLVLTTAEDINEPITIRARAIATITAAPAAQ